MDAKQDNGNVARLREEERLVFRQPPHNLEAEQALLGAVLVNNLAYNRVSDFLRPESNPGFSKMLDDRDLDSVDDEDALRSSSNSK